MSDDEECSICENEIQRNGDDIINLEEWVECDVECSICHRYGCYACLLVCYFCYSKNGQENNPTICTDCNGLEFLNGEIYMEKECEYHVWYACKKHRDKSCLECKHNSNLDLRNT